MILAAGRRAGGFRDAVPRRWQRRRAADSVRGAVTAIGRRRDFWQQVFWTRGKKDQSTTTLQAERRRLFGDGRFSSFPN